MTRENERGGGSGAGKRADNVDEQSAEGEILDGEGG